MLVAQILITFSVIHGLAAYPNEKDAQMEGYYRIKRKTDEEIIKKFCETPNEKKRSISKKDFMQQSRFKREKIEDVATGICGATPNELKETKEKPPTDFRLEGPKLNDIKLSKRQKKLVDDNKNNKGRSNITARKIADEQPMVKHWPSKYIPWEFAADFPNIAIKEEVDPKTIKKTKKEINLKQIIKSGMDHIEKYTCVRFVPKKATDKSYISFEYSDEIYSSLGMMDPDPEEDDQINVIYIASDAVRADVVHEILHAFGFIHEHQRADRDEYVKIHWQTLQSWDKDGYQYCTGKQEYGSKFLETDYGYPYDFNSVMHYPLYLHIARDGPLYAMTVKDKWKDCMKEGSRCNPGQKIGLSQTDANQVNAMFKCEKNPSIKDACTVNPRERATSLTGTYP